MSHCSDIMRKSKFAKHVCRILAPAMPDFNNSSSRNVIISEFVVRINYC